MYATKKSKITMGIRNSLSPSVPSFRHRDDNNDGCSTVRSTPRATTVFFMAALCIVSMLHGHDAASVVDGDVVSLTLVEALNIGDLRLWNTALQKVR